MTSPPAAKLVSRATTRRFALSAGEWLTTGLAAVVSTGAYLVGGHPYLARGVVGDLLGFAALAGIGVAVRARVEHEAAICLALIGLVVGSAPHRVGDVRRDPPSPL